VLGKYLHHVARAAAHIQRIRPGAVENILADEPEPRIVEPIPLNFNNCPHCGRAAGQAPQQQQGGSRMCLGCGQQIQAGYNVCPHCGKHIQ
jgi:hypothetical protein